VESHYFILMGDVIASHSHQLGPLNTAFASVVTSCNERQADLILSPLTITLGDEFQGIARDLKSAISLLFYLEESILRQEYEFSLRYVLYEGRIETPINRSIAHGMLGEGLTKAREMLNNPSSAYRIAENSRRRPRFQFHLRESILGHRLNLAGRILEEIQNRWLWRDRALYLTMIENDNNEQVGIEHGMTRSEVWKKRRSRGMFEYVYLKQLILHMVNEGDGRE